MADKPRSKRPYNAQPGNQNAVTSGARSEARIRPVARTQKRRLLRQIGLSSADLDGIGKALLDNWARAQAKVDLLDRHFEKHGFLDPERASGGDRVHVAAA